MQCAALCASILPSYCTVSARAYPESIAIIELLAHVHLVSCSSAATERAATRCVCIQLSLLLLLLPLLLNSTVYLVATGILQ
jgi:hypothetical protein